jgi:hypothetical protein
MIEKLHMSPEFLSDDEVVITIGPHQGNHYEEMIAELTNMNKSLDEMRAYAALFAAAPEILSSLQDIVATLVLAFPALENGSQISNARAAIEKATIYIPTPEGTRR